MKKVHSTMPEPCTNLPFWFRLEHVLVNYRFSRIMLYNLHRVRKKLYFIREERQKRLEPRNLRNFEERIFSQNGEDGMLREVFQRIGVRDRFFVEFGVNNGRECCTRHLLEDCSWSGVWIESVRSAVESAKAEFSHLPVMIVNEFLKAENIVSVFKSLRIPGEFDLLVLDVDGNEFWLWRELASICRPRVVVTEYNATFGPREEWVLPYDPDHIYDGTARTGASLASLDQLGRSAGYRLVGCDTMGVNAIFVREEDTGNVFAGVGKPVSYHFVAPHFDSWFGHAVRKLD